MKRRIIALLGICLLYFTIVANAADVDLSNIPPSTKQLYDQFKTEYTGHNDHWEADAKLVADLAAAPDADLCFLDAINPHKRDWRTITARKQLGILNTQRTFDIVAARLKSKNWSDRDAAVWEISTFKRPQCVTLLVNILNTDPDEQVRVRVAEALGPYADPSAEPDLLKAAHSDSSRLSLAAVGALAPLKSKEALGIAIGILQKSEKQDLENAVEIVASFHTKSAFLPLLREFKRLSGNDAEGWNSRLRHDIHVLLPDCVGPAIKDMGPFPDERLDEWEDWWTRVAPLLTDDMKLKTVTTVPQKWPDNEFAKSADAATFTAALDAKTYRAGDPIRLDLSLTNTGKSPISTVPPNLPSGWWPTMAYGIKLQRGDKVLLDLAPSSMYLGSYSGPPAFQTLAPAETWRSSVCLQYWINYRIATPLPEGDYQLEITFDSSQFAAIKPVGVQLVHRWTAPPVKFTIEAGESLKDPTEILAQIALKAHQKFLVADLSSPQTDRHDPAWRAVFEYGDSRLTPFVEKFESEHADHVYYYLNHKNLRPFEKNLTPPFLP